MLTGGTYADKFKELSKDRNNDTSPHHVQQLAARDRARKLSLETNRRRRALELKKRLEAQKETRRREEVLKERREKQQEATQKFQHRTKRASPARTPSDRYMGKPPYHNHHNSQLKADSANGSRGQPGTPNLEDALRLVGGHNNHGSYGSHTTPPGYPVGSGNVYQQEYSQPNNFLHRKYGMDSNANHITSSASGYHGYSTSATATYPSSSSAYPSTSAPLTSATDHATSVRLIQQSLHEQQRKFVEEQTKSLQEFNDAIMKEATPVEDVLERSDSLSSLDSLEEQPRAPAPAKTEVKENTRYSSTCYKPSGPAVTAGYYTNGTFNPPVSVATVHPLQKGPPVDNKTVSDAAGKFFVSNHRTLDGDNKLPGYPPQQNVELKVEEASETDIISEEVVEDRPMLLHEAMQLHSRQRSYADAVGHYVGRTSEAWVSQATPESNSHQSGASPSGAAVNLNDASRTNSARSRQLSAKTLATTVYTAVPNTNGSNIDHQLQAQRQVDSSPKQNFYGSPNRTVMKESTLNDRGRERSGVRFDETPTTRSGVRFDEIPTKDKSNSTKASTVNGVGKERNGVRFDSTPTSDKPPKAVKKTALQPVSILKKINSEKPAKLGGFKVRDSLEISKSSPVGQKSGKKSVRWGDDIEYQFEESSPVGSVKVQNVQDNGVEGDVEDNEVNDTPVVASQRQQKRPMSAAPGRDGRANSANGQGTSQKTRSNIYDNTSYAAVAAARKQQTDDPASVATAPATSTSSNARNVPRKLPPSGKASGSTSVSVKNAPVRGANGLRLDKTPTDDEINWLWDKVRTCLNSTDGQVVTQRPPSGQLSSRQPPTEPSPRQLATTSQCIDGGRITANLRVSQGRASSAVASSRGNGVPRWRTNSDSGTYLRKTALLHQRRQHSAISRGQGGGNGSNPSLPRQGSGQHQPVPSASHQGPSRTVTGPPQENVSDSLMAFQRAEQLAMNENASDAELAAAMDSQRIAVAKHEKAPSALSMEEQRIMESLDRLNDRLKAVTSETSTPYMGITPKPPPFGGGFRGHRPMSSRQHQHVMPADLVTIPLSSHVRASSADRSNVRINTYH